MDAQHNDGELSLYRGESSTAALGSPDRQQSCGLESTPEPVGHVGHRERIHDINIVIPYVCSDLLYMNRATLSVKSGIVL